MILDYFSYTQSSILAVGMEKQKYPMIIQLSGMLHKDAFDKLASFLQATERDFVVQLDCNIVLKDRENNK
jgi:hypothetical protein